MHVEAGYPQFLLSSFSSFHAYPATPLFCDLMRQKIHVVLFVVLSYLLCKQFRICILKKVQLTDVTILEFKILANDYSEILNLLKQNNIIYIV